MKKIKIFIASSIDDLKLDRVEIGNFFRQLNEIYLDNGIHFSLIMCEDYDNSIANGGKQSVYDDEIRESELCFFLFFRIVGDYTKHEFEVALESYRNTEKPKIVTYFKYVDSLTNVTDEVRSFMDMLDGELKHYYNTYGNLDTLKLGILMQIKMMKLDEIPFNIEDGVISVNGQPVADTNQIPMFSKNSDLALLKDRYKKLTTQYYELRTAYAENADDAKAYEKYSKTAKERAQIDEEIKTMEKQLLQYAQRAQEELSKNNFSQRQREGYRLVEIGDYDGALQVLDKNEIYKDIAHDEEIVDSLIDERIMARINELKQRIDILSARGIKPSVSKEIKEIYEVIYDKTIKYNLKKDSIYDYACYLRDQNEFESSLGIAEKLKYYYSSPDEKTDDFSKAMLYKLLADIYLEEKRMGEAEEAILLSFNIIKALTERDSDEYEIELARIYDMLGSLYFVTNRLKKAEEMLLAELEIAKKVVKNSLAFYGLRVAACYHNLGRIYVETNRKKEAEKMYLMSLEITDMLNKKIPNKKFGDETTVYNSLASLYLDLDRNDEAEKMYLAALEIRKANAEENPEKFLPDLADLYNNIGIFYNETNRAQKSIEAFTLSLDIRKRLAEKSPGIYNDMVAQSYHNFGIAYKHDEKYDDAEKMFLQALDILLELDKDTPKVYQPEIANSYNELALVYQNTGRIKEAEKLFLSAIEIRTKLTEEAPEVFGPLLVSAYFKLVLLYQETNSRKIVKTFLRMADIAKKYKDQDELCAKIADYPERRQSLGEIIIKAIIKLFRKEK